jgi:hypothetical protein
MKENTMRQRRRLPYLGKGGHTAPDKGACVMEYVSIAAHLPFNDQPKCVDENLRNFAVHVNDCLDPDERQRYLRPWLLRFVDTATSDRGRSRQIRDAIREFSDKHAVGHSVGAALSATADLDELFVKVDKILDRPHLGPATPDELEVVEKQRQALIEEWRHWDGPPRGDV